MKIRKFEIGGMASDDDALEAKYKTAGLAASNAENKKSSGFFGRLGEGNIDEKGSEAYNKYGAGYGREVEAKNDQLKAATLKNTAAPVRIHKMADPAAAPLTAASNAAASAARARAAAESARAAADKNDTAAETKMVRRNLSVPNAAGPSTTPDARDGGARDSSRFKKPAAKAPAPAAKAPEAAKAPAANTRTGATYKDMEKANARPAANPMSKDPSQQAPAPAGARASTVQKNEDSYADDTTLSFAERRKRAEMRAKRGSTTDARSANERIKDLFKAKGGAIRGYASGGSVSASRRGDGIAQRGKTRGKMC